MAHLELSLLNTKYHLISTVLGGEYSTYAHMFVYRHSLNDPDIDTELHTVTGVKRNFTINGTKCKH
jgi:tRNA U34 5-methylaminomethyl-2-thiouridine-forming methyltransferase MnmC